MGRLIAAGPPHTEHPGTATVPAGRKTQRGKIVLAEFGYGGKRLPSSTTRSRGNSPGRSDVFDHFNDPP
jgi:hypothetical protein